MGVPEVSGEVGVAHAILVCEIDECALGIGTNDLVGRRVGLLVDRGSNVEGTIDGRGHVGEDEAIGEDDVVVLVIRKALLDESIAY